VYMQIAAVTKMPVTRWSPWSISFTDDCEPTSTPKREVQEERTLGELRLVVTGLVNEPEGAPSISCESARAQLARYGIRIEPEADGKTHVWIANKNEQLDRALSKYAWGGNGWAHYLKRLPGAHVGPNPAWFAGSTCRYISIELP
jgi:hypothetical protein